MSRWFKITPAGSVHEMPDVKPTLDELQRVLDGPAQLVTSDGRFSLEVLND